MTIPVNPKKDFADSHSAHSDSAEALIKDNSVKPPQARDLSVKPPQALDLSVKPPQGQ
ncbi:MAG: hypothetical protein WCA89_12070 [Terracidiphilus sp.]|jgi:hypothetical protein